jgi:methyltransferase-like protein
MKTMKMIKKNKKKRRKKVYTKTFLNFQFNAPFPVMSVWILYAPEELRRSLNEEAYG